MKKIFCLFILVISILLFNNNVFAYEEYSVGDKIIYNNEEYYVIEDSNRNTNYLVLLKANPLTVDELYKYGRDEDDHLFVNEYLLNINDPEKIVYEFEGNIGGMAFYTSNECSAKNSYGSIYVDDSFYITMGCTNDYDKSDVKKVVDNWSKDKINPEDLVSVNEYKTRLLSMDDLQDNLNYEYNVNSVSFHPIGQPPEWLTNFSFWTMTPYEDSNDGVFEGNYSFYPNGIKYSAVRPVVNLNKCAIGENDKACNESLSLVCKNGIKYKTEIKYNKYKVGNQIEYNGEEYYVIENSSNKENYVTLLKKNPLSQKQIDLYSDTDSLAKVQYYSGDKCYAINGLGDSIDECISNYDNSKIKILVDNWANNYLDSNDLVNADGYNARLITWDEFNNIKNQKWSYNYSYWTMTPNGFAFEYYVEKNLKYVNNQEDNIVYSYKYIRPVINLLKEKVGNKVTYQIGDVVTYKNAEYYVIENSNLDQEYVKLLKSIPLTNSEISSDNIGNMAYYVSNTCESDSNNTGCISDYEKSNIKKVIDGWVNSEVNIDNLVEINGYKARLLTTDDLVNNLGYDYYSVITQHILSLTIDVPKWVYNNDYSYWTMSKYADSEKFIYTLLYNGSVGADWTDLGEVYDSAAVRPVINLNKCAIDDGCWEEKIEDGCIEDNDVNKDNTSDGKQVVTVANTLKKVSNIIFAISVVLIISGIVILNFNYIKKNKQKK